MKLLREIKGLIIPITYGHFFTDKQRTNNRIHEVPYKACFKPALVKFVIDKYCEPNDIIYDPFMGRGTVLIEGLLNNHNVIGTDLSAVAYSLTKPRVNNINLESLIKYIDNMTIDEHDHQENDPLLYFFHSKNLRELYYLRNTRDLNLNAYTGYIYMLILSRLTGHSPNFISQYTLPPNDTATIETQRKQNKSEPIYKDIKKIIKKKLMLLNHPEYTNASRVGNVSCLDFGTECDVVITSPPFLNIVDYNKSNWIREWFLKSNIKIETYSKISDYKNWMKKVITRLSVQTKKYIIIEVGETKNHYLETTIAEIAIELGLTNIEILIHEGKLTKTSNIMGIKEGTQTNRIVVIKL